MRIALTTLALVLLTSCKHYVVRDAEVYNAELAWFQQAGEQTAELSAEMLERNCKCDEEGYFEDPTCEELADNIVTIRSRMAWHVAMARYNAGVTEEKPPEEPPEIPEASTLCPEGEED